MVLSSIMKLKLGPFWLKTSILLVRIMPCGTQNTTCIFRIYRSGICGGNIELPVDCRGFLVTLIPRSNRDRQKLQFTLRYGAKGKKLKFRAPNAEAYSHWIAVLRKAFNGTSKGVKLNRQETVSTIHESCSGFSDSDNFSNSDVQNDHFIDFSDEVSTCGQRGSEATNTLITSIKLLSQGGVFEMAGSLSTPDVSSARNFAKSTDFRSHRSSIERAFISPQTLSLSLIPSEEGFEMISGQQKLFCVAIDCEGRAIFSVYALPQEAPSRNEMLLKLSHKQWAQWISRDLHDSDCLPEVYRLTSNSCNRLKLSEVQSIVQLCLA
ncbi:putative pleckstrin domain-containing protein [Plasmopara halstedii]